MTPQLIIMHTYRSHTRAHRMNTVEHTWGRNQSGSVHCFVKRHSPCMMKHLHIPVGSIAEALIKFE